MSSSSGSGGRTWRSTTGDGNRPVDDDAADPLEPWAVWRPRINEWDAALWSLLQRRLPDLWRVYRRENAVIAEDYGADWSREVLELLERRWQLLKHLSEREHSRGGGQ